MFRRNNNKGIGAVESAILAMAAITFVCTRIGMFMANRHHQQRIEKQETAEGRAEYPMKEKVELTPRELIRNSLNAGK